MVRPGQITIGLAPTRRDRFPEALRARDIKVGILKRLREIFSDIPDVELVDLEGVTEDGLLCELEDVGKAERHFTSHGVDALFVIHANFGQEEPVGQLAARLRVPVLLWGLRDGSPDDENADFRYADTQCGMFASSRALLRYGVPFTYIENCWLDAPPLEEGIRSFVRVASIVKSFRGMRILQIGTRPRQFLSVKVNEGELLERFGVEVTPVEVTDVLEAVERQRNNPAAIAALRAEWAEKALELGAMSEEDQVGMAAIELGILELAETYRCRAVASECWNMFRRMVGVRVCFVFGDLTAKGLPVSCENDIHGAVSSALLLAASRMESPSFLADITVRHPGNDNAELLWHCGPFPASLAKPGAPRALDPEGRGQWELRGGVMTLCRFDVDRGRYLLFADTVKGTDGPKTRGNYVWAETKDWPAWERRLMQGPYIHHIAGVHGDYKAELREACRFLGLIPDSVDEGGRP